MFTFHVIYSIQYFVATNATILCEATDLFEVRILLGLLVGLRLLLHRITSEIPFQ